MDMNAFSQGTFNSIKEEESKNFTCSVAQTLKNIHSQYPSRFKGPQIKVEPYDALYYLGELKKDLSQENIKKTVPPLANCLKMNLSNRTLASDHGAYKCLITLIEEYMENSSMLEILMSAMTNLTEENPDILTRSGMTLMLKIINYFNFSSTPETLEHILPWCYECCQKNEQNRQDLVEIGVMTAIVSILAAQRQNNTLVLLSSKCICAFLLYDDSRTEINKSQERAKMLVEGHKLIEELLTIIKDAPKLPPVIRYQKDKDENADWYTKECAEIKAQRAKAFKQYRKDKINSNFLEYKRLNAKARTIIRSAYRAYISSCAISLSQEYGVPVLEPDVAYQLVSVLSALCDRPKYCQRAVDNGVIPVIKDILYNFVDDNNLNKQAINLLKIIYGEDTFKDEVIKSGATELVISVWNKHMKSVYLSEAALGAISMFALHLGEKSNELGELGAYQSIIETMKMHPQEQNLQKLGCWAIGNMASRCPQSCLILKETYEAESVIRDAMKTFGCDIYDFANSALKDLGINSKSMDCP